MTVEPLTIKNPDREFMEIAEECIANGTFDEAIRRMTRQMIEATKANNRKEIAYYTRAFKAFLRFKGGNYGVVV